MKLYANLHLHSAHSDGPYTPKQLVSVARDEGYCALALTDHDTVSGCGQMEAACNELGMEFIFGAEFTVKEPHHFHIVGFDFNPNYQPMREYLACLSEKETHQTRVLFERAIQDGGISGITWQEVLDYNRGITWLCNNHVFAAMKAKGLVRQSEYMEFFHKNYGAKRSTVQSDIRQKTAGERIELIHKAGGIAVLAHPNNQLQYVPMLIEAGLDGIEVWHPDLKKEQQLEAFELALRQNLFISGGSDHSGLCGGYYDSYPSREALLASNHYIQPMSAGTTREFFNELKTRKKDLELRNQCLKDTPFIMPVNNER